MTLNIQQEKFAIAYAKTHHGTKSAIAAGYSTKNAAVQGSRLLKNEEIKERIEELEKEQVTDVNIIEELEEQLQYAKTNNNQSHALKTLEVLGKFRPASEEDAKKSVPELEHDIAKFCEVLGKERLIKILRKIDWKVSIEHDNPNDELVDEGTYDDGYDEDEYDDREEG